MEKYIKLRMVKEVLQKLSNEPRYQHAGEDYYTGICIAAEELSELPIIELRSSKWIKASNKPGVNIGMKCAICGARIKNSEYIRGNHRFCHKCGARMTNVESND